MSKESFDPNQYKAGQRQEWDAAAVGWKKWWEVIERGGQRATDRLLELAHIEPGHRVLDIATGIGEPAVTAARQVGSKGRVVATDQSPQMLAIARERATELGLQNIEFREMDAEALDFPENSFDAILCRFGLMFFPNLDRALASMRNLLTPGGRLVASVWDAPDKVPMVSLTFGVTGKILQLPPPPEGIPGPFSLADSTGLEQKLRQAGFTDVRSEWQTFTLELPSAEAYTNFIQDIAAPVNALLADRPAELQQEIWQAITDAAQAYAAADGSISMPNVAICVVGQR
ncbi:MAG: class I SAM-dependent methyltransferase [Candidatus Bipolaricaulia bacterium]